MTYVLVHGAAVVAEIEPRDFRDVVLVGHSLAGITLPGVAACVPDRLSRVGFVAATVPEHGQSVVEALEAATREVAAANRNGGEFTSSEGWALVAVVRSLRDGR